MKGKICLGVIVFLGIFILLPAGSRAAEEIKIGLVTPLSAPGDYEAGKINVQTVELAVDELNGKGGVLGRKIALVKADDEGKPAVGVTAVQRVIGVQTKAVQRGSSIGLHGGQDTVLPTSGPLPPPWRYDDHYGFGSLSCIE